MPKIGKKSFSFKEGYREFEIWYNSKDGFYLKNFPEEIIKLVRSADGLRSIYYDTESELISDYQNLIARYYALVQTEEHVITISLSLSAEIVMNKTGKGSYSGSQQWAEKIFDLIKTSGYSTLTYNIGFDYETGIIIRGKEDKFFETEQDESGNIIKRSQYGSSHRDDKSTAVIPYTIEAEMFLKYTGEQMKMLAKKMALFLTDKPKLLGAIKNKQFLLENKQK